MVLRPQVEQVVLQEQTDLRVQPAQMVLLQLVVLQVHQEQTDLQAPQVQMD
jgi:hypothetical protein